jgi:Tol biopolymer transport system component
VSRFGARPREGGTWIIDADTGERIRRISRRPAAVLDWSPDGRTLLFGPACGFDGLCDPDLYILRRDGTRVRRLTDTPKREETDAVWSPDGRRIAFVRTGRNPQILDLDHDGARHPTEAHLPQPVASYRG